MSLPVATHAIHVAINYPAIMPELLMMGGAIALLGVASLVRRPLRVTVATIGTVLISGTSLGWAIWLWLHVFGHGPEMTLDHAVVSDGFSALVSMLVASAMVLTALVGDGYLRREGIEGPEFHVLAMISASGAMLMGAANDLIIVFLGLEILSISLYVLAAFNHRRAASGEAALKYFVLGGFSSAIFVYGIALTYGATGSTNLTQIADYLSRHTVASSGILLAGLSLLLVGFAFKIAAVPFHMWTPDVYQGSPSPVTGFMAAVAKIGAFAALLRVFVSTFGILRADWQPIVYGLAIVTLLLGAGFAVVQRDIKRMLAYSSINHAGFILLGLEAATRTGVSASLYYLVAYTFMVVGTFAIVTVLGREGDGSHDIASYRGLAHRQPLLAAGLAVLLLAQAGMPFTTGLTAKLHVVLAAIGAGSVPLAVIAMVSAAVAVFFYLRVTVLMYATDGVRADLLDTTLPGHRRIGAGELATDRNPDLVEGIAPGTGTPLWSGTERMLAGSERRNSVLLLESDAISVTGGDPSGTLDDSAPGTYVDEEEGVTDQVRDRVRVPVLTSIAIGLCLAITIGFGVFPTAYASFAQHARLLFFP